MQNPIDYEDRVFELLQAKGNHWMVVSMPLMRQLDFGECLMLHYLIGVRGAFRRLRIMHDKPWIYIEHDMTILRTGIRKRKQLQLMNSLQDDSWIKLTDAAPGSVAVRLNFVKLYKYLTLDAECLLDFDDD